MKILYLYAELMGYTMATIRAIVKHDVQVHIVYWDYKKSTPYEAPVVNNVCMYKRSEYCEEKIHKLVKELTPKIIVISGWMDNSYIKVAKHFRSKGLSVVLALDSQWYGTLRQKIATLLSYIGYFKKIYTHAWVAGAYQFEYVRRLGFNKENIIYDLLCADLSLFDKAYEDTIVNKINNYPHRFLYVGRFENVKGLDILINAWVRLGNNKNGWELHLIGNGTLKNKLKSIPGIIVSDFMLPARLIKEVSDSGCFLLPSREEPWGLVVQEFAAAGLPLIVSDVVGAAATFLISNMNGFTFTANDPDSLVNMMLKIISMSDHDIYCMALKSRFLSQRITPETSAANLMSILY